MLLYYLGLAPVLKNAAYQASSQEASVAQLADVERRLAGAATGAADYARHLREAQHVFRDDIVDNTRLTTWNKVRSVRCRLLQCGCGDQSQGLSTLAREA